MKRIDLERQLLEIHPPTFSAWHVSEPELLFAHSQRTVDPKSGLAQFGPFDIDDHPVIRLGIVGTGHTIDQTDKWLDKCHSTIYPSQKKLRSGAFRAADPVLFPSFPGARAESGLRFTLKVTRRETIPPKDIDAVLNTQSFSERLAGAVMMIARRLDVIRQSEAPPSAIIVALPREIEASCRTKKVGGAVKISLSPAQRRALKKFERLERSGQKFLFDMKPTLGIEESSDAGHQNLRRYLKVRAMQTGIPVQLVWPATLEHSPGTQDEATTAWNLIVGLYYKAGGIPWRLAGLHKGTCYVGVSFYRERGSAPSVRTSLAQVFSEQTDGIVLRGEPFEWKEDRGARSPHLDQLSAKKLAQEALDVYRRTTHTDPERVVIHKSSRYTDEELRGFNDAVSNIAFHDFVAIHKSELRFLRIGNEPPVRGTAIDLESGRFLLYTRGYVPYLGAYPGMRIPIPLEISEHHGTGSIRQVCDEILALTKMNWNTADFACWDPITLAFAREVGLILAEMEKDQTPASSYRFYM